MSNTLGDEQLGNVHPRPVVKTAIELQRELDRAMSVLEMYGVPRGRARTVDNGIQVLVTRMQREIDDKQREITRLLAVKGEQLSAPEIIWQRPLIRCAAGRDGDCIHPDCPQNKEGEPAKTGRHCPLDVEDDEDN